jgi:preprotein translocase subunit SecB
MTQTLTAKNGGDSAKDGNNKTPQTQVRVLGQYIKDVSFENPNVHKLLGGQGDGPNLRLEVNVNGKEIAKNVYESAIQFKAEATNKAGVIYDLELLYAGLFQIEHMPIQAMEQFLLINCPALLFPFLRRIVADLTRDGGFPPLMLDPIDFAALYLRRQQELNQQAKSSSLS